jgi:hypothetical protein
MGYHPGSRHLQRRPILTGQKEYAARHHRTYSHDNRCHVPYIERKGPSPIVSTMGDGPFNPVFFRIGKLSA